MADRLSQLQDAVNVQAENLCNSIGLLQQSARPESFKEFSTFSRSSSNAYLQVLQEAGIPIDINIDGNETVPAENNNDLANNVKSEDQTLKTNDKLKDSSKDGQPVTKQQNGEPTTANDDGAGPNDNPSQIQDPGANSLFFAKLITKTAKDIDLIIDSLPSREMEPDLQEAHIRRLQIENSEEAKKLEDVIHQAEQLLDVIKDALKDIAQNQMRMKQLEAQMLASTNVDNDDCPFS